MAVPLPAVAERMNNPKNPVVFFDVTIGGQSDGTGSFSIYGGSQFADENFQVKHSSPGMLSMANSGRDTNGCQFFITCAPCDFLDGKHVVFGQIVDGMLVLKKIENVPTGANNRPKVPVLISQCGEM
ncbi:unnamed protein product [Echinostoma caproni]|uniref:Peptidyl-prolyl cis-trans isomerase n=1 Tax=Echinostoma caproni TaxID=27848 RepID=A0A183AK95_9TREM|nr:unnamed protein product [Echinostoma caproni]